MNSVVTVEILTRRELDVREPGLAVAAVALVGGAGRGVVCLEGSDGVRFPARRAVALHVSGRFGVAPVLHTTYIPPVVRDADHPEILRRCQPRRRNGTFAMGCAPLVLRPEPCDDIARSFDDLEPQIGHNI